jgi:SAM-dependent methyltransferase
VFETQGMAEYSAQEARQRAHYDSLGDSYEISYSDAWATLYRDRFIHEPLFGGLDLKGLEVLEAMAGAGSASNFLSRHGAQPTGLDISDVQLASYRRNCPGRPTVCAPIASTNLESESFDLVVTIGGLHHLHPALSGAIDEIHRLLRPRGIFCFCEPHTHSLLDVARQAWYRWDPLFAEEEAAIDVRGLKAAHLRQFDFEFERYMGNIAYVSVLNSMVLRIPAGLKQAYAPLAMEAENVLNHLLPSILSCYVLARWRKK